MRRYVVSRVLLLVPTLFGIALLTFLLANLTPGDPAYSYYTRLNGRPPAEQELVQVRSELGLDRPVAVRFADFVGGAVTGDLGVSYSTRRPVTDELFRRIGFTVQLAIPAAVLALLVAVPAGVLCAVRRNRVVDQVVRVVSLVGASIPSFWLALVLISVFAVQLHLVPVAGRGSPAGYMLPVLTLAMIPAATLTRFTRSAVLEVMGSDHVLAARAKGLRELRVVGNHALRNAMIPLVTAFSTSVAGLFAGAAVVETIFVWPGVGKLLVDAILERDHPTIQGTILYAGVAFAVINLVVDLTYAALDPRVSVGRGAP
ncbi:ABC transporter permease [Pseudonocardia kunmingensis]|uniref:Peptide/nickel transport system permease protein n=1 Tax=Pseudonocardia kunmingensis TaxID=630975 RepID=A0A543DP60_9PSEU|nr:ABC transporter permease [Pseudonocardia kunmingensis]TQM11111.1 peptide/nickel transport system permease protein [Pseudonocardia kunmingensis]